MGKNKRTKRARENGSASKKSDGSSPRKAPPWARWFALVLLMGVHAFLLAGVFNPAPHSGGDNAGYLTLAYSLLERGQYLDLYDPAEPPHTKYPPGFPLVLAGAMLLGARTWAQFKVLSGLAIFATVGLSVAWAWRRRGWEFGIAVGAVLAFANAFLYASQWILSDPLFLVLTMAALVAFDASEPQNLLDDLGATPRDVSEPPASSPLAKRWLALGIAATVIAFFTRSAGLPLVVAVGLWLLWRRRFGAVAVFAVSIGIPAGLWWLRDQMLGGPGYTGEFWLVNPYQPALGRAGPLDLLGRVTANAVGYFTAHIPTGFVGSRGSLVAVLGVVIVGLATLGWVRRVRRPGVPEFFAPLYLGLILLWPEVWSGDRFALPLFPLLVFYAGDALLWATRTLPRMGRTAIVGMALAVVVVPSASAWQQSARQAEMCRARIAQGPFACYGPRLQEFVAAANWTQSNLTDDAVVFSRKPRIFYVVSGTKSKVFPLSSDPDVLIAAADSAGAEYVVIDHLDNLAAFYLIPILQNRPNVFCTIRSFGGDARGISTELLGLRTHTDDEVEVTEGDAGTVSVALNRCPESMMGQPGDQSPSSPTSNVVPLLVGLDS